MKKVVPPHFRSAVDAIPDIYPGLRDQLKQIIEWMESTEVSARIHYYPTVMLTLGLWEAELRTHTSLLEDRLDNPADPFEESPLPFDVAGNGVAALASAQSLLTMLAALREAWDPEILCASLRLQEEARSIVVVEGKANG